MEEKYGILDEDLDIFMNRYKCSNCNKKLVNCKCCNQEWEEIIDTRITSDKLKSFSKKRF